MASQCTVNIERRNIVVVGKTGCGKSTVANQLIGNEVFQIGRSSKSVTEHPGQKEAKRTVDDIEYNIKVIDTVGLFDSASPAGSNKDILREAKAFFQKNVKGLNLILFVFKEGRFTDEEKKTFSVITKHFKKDRVGEISALVVTNCENIDEAERERLY